MHLWHDISIGNQSPQIVKGIIEIAQQTRAKYEIDKETGLIKLDRMLSSSVVYPINYGIMPQTLWDDGDPLDLLVMAHVPLISGCLVQARVIGVMQMIDSGSADDKIIAVAINDNSVDHLQDIEDIPKHYLAELKNFFETYKQLENKAVTVANFLSKQHAYKCILRSQELYQQKFINKTPY